MSSLGQRASSLIVVFFQGEYEIVGDRCYPNSFGASLSRQTRKKIFSGLKIRITGDSESFSKGIDKVVDHIHL